MFYEKQLQKTNQTEFRIEKVVKRKGDKVHVKSKGYDNLLDPWTDETDTVTCYIFFSFNPSFR